MSTKSGIERQERKVASEGRSEKSTDVPNIPSRENEITLMCVPSCLRWSPKLTFILGKELETYSRSAMSGNCSVVSFTSDNGRPSGLHLSRHYPYRTDPLSLRAVTHSPAPAKLEDIRRDEARDSVHHRVSEWLSSVEMPDTHQLGVYPGLGSRFPAVSNTEELMGGFEGGWPQGPQRLELNKSGVVGGCEVDSEPESPVRPSHLCLTYLLTSSSNLADYP